MYSITIKSSDLFKCFQVDLGNYFNTRTRLVYHLHIQPSEYEDKPFYEFQYYIKELVKIIEEKNGNEKNEDYNSQYDDMKSKANSYMKNVPKPSNSFGKMPKFK